MSELFKREVLTAFQKVSPSKIGIEAPEEFLRYENRLKTLFFNKLKFPIQMFSGQKVLDFGCGTGEVDMVLAKWGASVDGFDFNPISVARAMQLRASFGLETATSFAVGEVDEYSLAEEAYDIVGSFGVIAHVPDQKNMFRRMAGACKPGGFVLLGYIEDAGLIQRLLHRAIVLANSEQSDEEIFRIATACFSEHIERSVKHGGRTAESVINDYLVNPHYIGISSQKLFSWASQLGLEYYSAWPNDELPFVVDSPYFKLIAKNSKIYSTYLSLLRLRWLYAQAEDESVFADLLRKVPAVDDDIEAMFAAMNNILQGDNHSDAAFRSVEESMSRVEAGVAQFVEVVRGYALGNLAQLNSELLRILEMVVTKYREGKVFELRDVGDKLFKGYNGLVTSYVIFHKPS